MATHLKPGDPAPDFTLKDQDNESVSLADYRGRNVVLMFYPLAFSPTCTKELSEVTRTAEKFDAAGAAVLGVSVDSRWALKAWKDQWGYQARLLADFNPKGEVARAYGTYLDALGFAERTTFVIDAQGTIAQVIETPMNEVPDADAFLEALAACSV